MKASLFDFVEQELGISARFAGSEFSAADPMMSFPLRVGGARAGAFEGRARIKAFVQRIHARTAYRARSKKAAPTLVRRKGGGDSALGCVRSKR